jgi:CDGSH-type Zn-finger protein
VLRGIPTRNGPLQVESNLEICAGTGRTVDRVTRTFLYRCGNSQDKPFCDGSHGRVSFSAAGA